MDFNWTDATAELPADTDDEIIVAWINGEVTKEIPRTVQWNSVDFWAVWPKHPTRENRGECKSEYCYNSWRGSCMAKKTDEVKLGEDKINGCPSYKELYKRYIHVTYPPKQGC